MKNVSFTDFRKNASSLISEVESGQTIQLIRHGKPVATISPVTDNATRSPVWKRPGLGLVVKGEGLSKAILEERGGY